METLVALGSESAKVEVRQKADYLLHQLDVSFKDLHKHRKDNRRNASVVKFATLLFSTIATVLLGIHFVGYEVSFKNVAFVFSALVTLLNALEPFYNFRSLWVEHELAIARLYRLKNDIDFYLIGKDDNEIEIDALQLFLNRYEDVWNSLNDNYIKFRRSET